MTPDSVIEVGQQAMEVTALLSAVLLLPALVVGLVVAMFQAATQINEMTLSFIPKLMVVALALMLAGPWMLRVLMNFSQSLIGSVPELIG